MPIFRVPSALAEAPTIGPSRLDVFGLRELVRRHKVYWLTSPEHLLDKEGRVVKVGFQVHVWGTHDHPGETPTAGCSECVKVYRDLRHLARSILPTDRRDSYSWISHFDSALSYPAPGRKDVEIRIKVLHRNGFDQPIDDCQRRCLREIALNLEKLGAQKGRWQDSRV